MARDPNRIDFSSLDPSQQPARWEAMIAATLTRARPLATVHPLFSSLASRGRVALALAATLALVAWLPSLFAGGESGSGTIAAQKTDAATQLALWASRGGIPADTNVFDTFGAAHVSE